MVSCYGNLRASKVALFFAVLSVQVCLTMTLWTVAHQTPLSMGFSRQIMGEGCHALLQGIFLTQGSNLCL